MGCPKGPLTDEYEPSTDDDLGRLIRQSLQDSVAGAEPSARVWSGIVSRVREMNAAASAERKPRRSLLPIAPLVQAVVISALLLAFGLGVDHNWNASRRNYRVSPTPIIQKTNVRAKQVEDVLRGYMLFRRQQESLPAREGRILDVSIPQ